MSIFFHSCYYLPSWRINVLIIAPFECAIYSSPEGISFILGGGLDSLSAFYLYRIIAQHKMGGQYAIDINTITAYTVYKSTITTEVKHTTVSLVCKKNLAY